MLNAKSLCRRRLVPVLGLVSCAVFTPIAWGGASRSLGFGEIARHDVEAEARASALDWAQVLAASFYTETAFKSGVLPCESMALKVRYLMDTMVRMKGVKKRSITRWRIKQIQEFVQKGRDFYEKEAKNLRASDSDDDKEKLEQLKKDMENFPYCNGEPLFHCLDRMRSFDQEEQRGVLRIRFDIISKEGVLPKVFTQEAMRDAIPDVIRNAPDTLREQLIARQVLSAINDEASPDSISQPNRDETLAADDDADCVKGLKINYDKAYKIFEDCIQSRRRKENDACKYTSRVIGKRNNKDLTVEKYYGVQIQNWFDVEQQLLRSKVLLRNLLKEGALQLFSGALHEMVKFDRSAMKAGEDPAKVEGQAVIDFMDLVKMLHEDPNNNSEWK